MSIQRPKIVKVPNIKPCIRLVRTREELIENMDTLDRYLENKAEPEYEFGCQRIKRGIHFIVREKNGKKHFYPSRFIGYAHNSKEQHENNERKDGKVTTPCITKILKQTPYLSPELELAYQEFCMELGFTPNPKGAYGGTRKYWKF